MGFLSRLFGGGRSASQQYSRETTTTADRPFCIQNPQLGFCNLMGERGEALMAADRNAMQSIFPESRATTDNGACQVLFVYCDIDANGRIVGTSQSFRDLAKTYGALILVIASENAPEHYMKANTPRNGWNANIVLTLDRKQDVFATFMPKLFAAMFRRETMLMAWVRFAPQIPGLDHPDCPDAIMLAEAGHLTFAGTGRSRVLSN